MANAYKCDFCGVLTEGKSSALTTEIYGNEGAHRRSRPFVGTLSISHEITRAEVCPPCIRKFAQCIIEGK